MKSLTLICFLVLAGCTASITGADRDITEAQIAERMDTIGQRFAWYCGSEGVSLRAAVRVTASVVFTIASLGEIPDLCSGYNEARAEAINQIRAEREALESGLLDLQTEVN